ncbi:MAG: PIG-L family deacetylase [Chloroflexi bacterium]|nr:PIG-L family deacetylase [Chloroflexota bacterium]
MRWIYLSPHLDDAVLSCGGIIFTQRKAGIPVEIWNWMSGIPADDQPLSDLARSVHAGWEFDTAKEAFTSRLAEDRLAASRVGASARYFDFFDCIYRISDGGEFLYAEELFVPPPPADDKLVDEIAALITENLRPGDILVSPLTIGNHPDHIIVRRAAEQIGHPLRYYADIPYSIWYPDQFTEMTKGLKAETNLLSKEDLRTWQDAVSAYVSQLGVLFGGEEMMKKALRLYWQKLQGIQIFQ